MRSTLVLLAVLILGCVLGTGCKDSCEKMHDKFMGCIKEMGASQRFVDSHMKTKEKWLEGCRSREETKKRAAECVKKDTCKAFIACFSKPRRR